MTLTATCIVTLDMCEAYGVQGILDHPAGLTLTAMCIVTLDMCEAYGVQGILDHPAGLTLTATCIVTLDMCEAYGVQGILDHPAGLTLTATCIVTLDMCEAYGVCCLRQEMKHNENRLPDSPLAFKVNWHIGHRTHLLWRRETQLLLPGWKGVVY